MLDPESFGKRVQEHFASVSDEDFVANLERYNPDLVRELEVQRSTSSGMPDDWRAEQERSAR